MTIDFDTLGIGDKDAGVLLGTATLRERDSTEQVHTRIGGGRGEGEGGEARGGEGGGGGWR